MSRRIVIVGGVALGPKVASRARRLDPDAEITVIDRDSIISYGGCGMPYYVSGDITDAKELYSTTTHAVRDVKFFQQVKRVEMRTRTEALSINRQEKSLDIRDLETGQESTIAYDTLVWGTGAMPVLPPVEGVDLPGVHALSSLHQAIAIKDMIAKGKVERAVVVGGGAIGVEMAEALTELWGVETTLVEMRDQLLPDVLARDMALMVQKHMHDSGVTTLTSTSLKSLTGDKQSGVQAAQTSAGTLPCELVILATGVRPNTAIARAAGLTVGETGGLVVNSAMQTSDPAIYAGGDCVEVRNGITGKTGFFPLGSLANRQGRVIGTNVAGGSARFPGAVGTFCLKVFDMAVAAAGLTEKQAADSGFDAIEALAAQSDRAHFFPGEAKMSMRLVADAKTRQVLGVQAFGPAGDAVKGRVDAVACLLARHPVISDISSLEVGYTPPYGSAMDIVNAVANTLENILDGCCPSLSPLEFLDLLDTSGVQILDIRSQSYAEPFMEKYGTRWLHIPQEELIDRLDEVPKHKPLIMFCNTGTRSFESLMLLRAKGYSDLDNVQGGAFVVRQLRPDITD